MNRETGSSRRPLKREREPVPVSLPLWLDSLLVVVSFLLTPFVMCLCSLFVAVIMHFDTLRDKGWEAWWAEVNKPTQRWAIQYGVE